MLSKNTLDVKKVRGQSALQTGATKNFEAKKLLISKIFYLLE